MLTSILDLLTQDGTIAALAGAAVGLFLFLVKIDKTRRIVQKAAHVAYDVVNVIKDATPTKIDDKAALALKVISDSLDRELSKTEVAVALKTFEARHADESAAVNLAAKVPAELVARHLAVAQKAGQ